MTRRFSATVMKLIELGTPYYSDGKWRKPVISRREMDRIRRVMMIDGHEWPVKFFRDRGDDIDRKFKKEKKKEEKKALIAENMRKMPDMIAEYYEKARAKRKSLNKRWTEEETYRLATGRPIRDNITVKKKKK